MKRCTYCESDLHDDLGICDHCGREAVADQSSDSTVIDDSSAVLPTEDIPYPTSVSENSIKHQAFTPPPPLYTEDAIAADGVIPASPVHSSDAANGAGAGLEEEEQGYPAPFFAGPGPSASQKEEEFVSLELATLPGNTAPRIQNRLMKWLISIIVLLALIATSIGVLLVAAPQHHPSNPPILLAKLHVTPASLDFGKIEQGSRVILAVVIANAGKQVLNWSVDADGTAWLKVGAGNGTIKPGGPQQFIYTTADTSTLTAGSYTGSEQIHSNAGNAQVPIKLQVIPASGPKRALLNVNPSFQNLGTLPPSVQQMFPIIVGNVGMLDLNWKANVGNTSWMSISPKSGTVQAGSFPQTINVEVNTANLKDGNYSSTINITSNGGNSKTDVALTVSSSPQPTQTAGSQPPIPSPGKPGLTVNPASLSSSSNYCNPNGDGTYSCAITLGETASGNVNWRASSSVGGVISPSSGQLTPGQSQIQVQFLSITCENGLITFTPSDGMPSVNVNWTCISTPVPPPSPTTPPPTPPQLNVSPQSLSFNNVAPNTTQTQQITVSNSGGQALSWSANTSANWMSLDNSGGNINPGSNQTINLTVNTTGLSGGQTYNGSVNFTSNGGNFTLPVTLSVSSTNPPFLSVYPSSIYANNDCTWAPGQNNGIWSCTLRVSNDPNASSNLNWTTSSSGFGSANMTASFSPSSGTLAPGASQQVALSVITGSTRSSCWQSFSATLIFQGPNTANVPWSCNAPTYTSNTHNINGDTDCQHVQGNPWYCSVTLTQQSQGYINFSTEQQGDGSAYATFNPCCGETFGPGQSVTVQVTVTVNGSCPASDTLIFNTYQPVNVNWSCTNGNGAEPHFGTLASMVIQDRWIRRT